MKRVFSLIIITALLLSGAITVHAEEVSGGNWYVHFSSDAKMNSNFTSIEGDKMTEALYALQPGDRATFYMEIRNDYVETTDWYMANKVLKSLESSQTLAEGGAYSYILTYYDYNGTANVLYSSESVGGEDEENLDKREGLHEATSSLEDWFFLDTLAPGRGGHITLIVELEGETQGNRYQDTLAQLQMNFAVELTQDNVTHREFTSVRTGEVTNQNPTLVWPGVMLGCGVAIMILAFIRLRKNDDEEASNNA